jgi:hypothetical protein
VSRNQQQQPQLVDKITPAQAFNVFYLCLAGYAACFWPFTRVNFGVNAFQISGLAAMAVMYLYAAFCPCPEMVLFFAVWLFLIVCHRIVSLRNEWRGWGGHSCYDGYPWLVMWLKPHNEFIAKVLYEPVILLFTGLFLCRWSEPLGGFVLLGGLPIVIKKTIERGMEITQVRVMKDRAFELRARAARFRKVR